MSKNEDSLAKKYFIVLLQHYIPESFCSDHEKHHQASVLVSLLVVYLVVLFLVSLYLIFILPLPGYAAIPGYGICVVMSVSYFWLLNHFKKTGNFELCCNLTVALALLAVSVGVLVTGGMAESMASPILSVPPALAAILLGRRGGVVWMLVTIALFTVLTVLDFSGMEFINTVDPLYVKETRVAVHGFMVLVVVSMIFAYEATVMRLRKERDLVHARFVYLASHDELTSLPNRTKFNDNLEKTVQNQERRNAGSLLALAVMDLDGFKPVNDRYGHQTGDEVLKHVSLRVTQCL